MKGEKISYFVRWDNGLILTVAGGRWYECSVYYKWGPDYHVRTHDGYTGKFSKDRMVQVGQKPNVGDEVLAYFDNREYAHRGTLVAVGGGGGGGQMYIKYADGSYSHVLYKNVHALVVDTDIDSD